MANSASRRSTGARPRGGSTGFGLFSLLAGLLLNSPLLAQDPPAGAFADPTDPSGVAAVVARHYKAAPKWWLSGMTLVDLDGDGALDLHLGSHSGGAMPGALASNDGKGRFTYVDPQLSIPRGAGKRDDLPYPAAEI